MERKQKQNSSKGGCCSSILTLIGVITVGFVLCTLSLSILLQKHETDVFSGDHFPRFKKDSSINPSYTLWRTTKYEASIRDESGSLNYLTSSFIIAKTDHSSVKNANLIYS